MSKESRLCYHAVPRILKIDIGWLNAPIDECTDKKNSVSDDVDTTPSGNCKKRRLTPKSNNNEYSDAFEDGLWNDVLNQEQWKPFSDYISDCRINVNVRQVLNQGEQSID